MRLVGLCAFVLLGALGCGESDESSKSDGARGGGSGSGTGGTPVAGSGGSLAGSGGSSGGTSPGGASGAGASNAGAAGAPLFPPDTVVLGPFAIGGSISGVGDSHEYDLRIPPDGLLWFTSNGALVVGQAATVASALFRPPTGNALGRDWLCAGSGATWTPTSTDDTPDCDESRCHYTLLFRAPTRLSCGGGSGTLSFAAVAPAPDATTTASSSLPELDGKTYYVSTFTPLMPDPNSTIAPSLIHFSEATTNGPPSRLKMLFTATPVIPAMGGAVTTWTLSDISVLYRPAGTADDKQLLCATSGTYSITATEPIEHSVTLSGVSDIVACPGAPLETPVAVLLER